ncbi:hypothetical protein BG006_005903 [Podila minutissima]|uniref:Dynamin N-terminal domain-containing protein n=1 Tax=Podila minutissima TaxID=64525 RepID=A0A9P5VR06_9FUNG|nr:hypothetical protein BG006_005903 [Podila minutissima]
MDREDVEIHSVLVLGKSQAGKSALIQNIKSYAAQNYPIDRSLLGDGTFSKTDTPRFVFTYVDYLHSRFNTDQNLALKEKSRSLSRLCSGFVAGDFEPYPSFTIDLSQKKRPVVQCMIRTTLKDILQLAASSPMTMVNTSIENVERIKSILHPSNFDNKKRKTALDRIYEDLMRQSKVQVKEMRVARTLAKPKYSVLILGHTQSGKSTLVQQIKKYANPAHEIDQSFLEGRNVPKTFSTVRFSIDSSLPLYEVQKKDDGSIVNLLNLQARLEDEEDYLKLIAGREKDYTLRISPQDSQARAPQLVEFQFLDTPGLNDADQRDTVFADNIIREIFTAQKFNLILVAVSAENPLSMGYGFAIEYYAKVLEGLHSNIAFLYTHVDYADGHYSNTAHHKNMATRHRAFSNIFRYRTYAPAQQGHTEGGDSLVNERVYLNFAIDMKSDKQPIVQCLIRNTLRDILQLAMINPPVNVDTSEANSERIRTLVHPDNAHQEYRDRFRDANSAKIPKLPASGDDVPSATWSAVSNAAPVDTAGLAPMTLVDLSETGRNNLTVAPRADESALHQHSATIEKASLPIDQSILGDIDHPTLGNVNQPTLGRVDQPTHGDDNQPTRGHDNQPTRGDDDQPTRDRDNQRTRDDDDQSTRDDDDRSTLGDDQSTRGDDQSTSGDYQPAEMYPDGLRLGGMSLKERSFTNSEVEMDGDDDQSEGRYVDPQDLKLPIREMLAEHDTEDLGYILDDSANAPDGRTEYVLPSTTYSVLFLGETQSGKSTLIESLKQYANPDYTINTRRIGDGSFSLTNDVRIERITSNIPTSYIFKASDKTQELVDHEAFIEEDQEDYEDELNDRKSYQLATKLSDIPNAYYNLIDTPGLNNTGSNDKSTLEYIFKRIGNISELNLVVVTVSNNPFTQDLKDALKNYFKLLKDFKGHLVFVHTKIDYAKLHRDDDQFKQLLEEKNNILHGLLSQEDAPCIAPHIMIDNDLGSKKAVRNCMTQNYLRSLLDMARTNKPVRLPAQYIYTPPVYRDYSQSYGYSEDSYSPHGGYGHRRMHSRDIVVVSDPCNAVIIAFITNVLLASGYAPDMAFDARVIGDFKRAHCS